MSCLCAKSYRYECAITTYIQLRRLSILDKCNCLLKSKLTQTIINDFFSKQMINVFILLIIVLQFINAVEKNCDHLHDFFEVGILSRWYVHCPEEVGDDEMHHCPSVHAEVRKYAQLGDYYLEIRHDDG